MHQVRDQQRNTDNTADVATSVGILYRVSSKGQDEDNQIPELESHCFDQGYRINRRYPLHDKSAYKGEHEAELENVLDDIRKGIIQVVVIVHSSRIDRRDPDIATLYHLSVKAAGGSIESVREPLFGKSDIAGQITTLLAHNSNHDYSKSISGHVQAANNRIRTNRATSGKGLFGRAPFGYEITGNRYEKVLVPTDLGKKYIPEIFDRVIKGDSTASVADWLNSEGVPTGCKTRNGQPVKGWTNSPIGKIIRNTVYKGQMWDSNHEYAGPCEHIVSPAVFDAAGKRLDQRPQRGPNNGKSLLTSHLFCVVCKSPMHKAKNNSKVPYYRCSGKLAADGKSCLMIKIPVVDALTDEAMTGDDTQIMELALVPGENYDDELDQIKAQIKALDLDADDYDDRYSALIAERKRIKELDTTPDRWEEIPTGETYGGKWAEADFTGKRAMLKDITVYAGRNESGEAYAIVDINRFGLVQRHIAGQLPGPSIMERAKASGLAAEVEAEFSE